MRNDHSSAPATPRPQKERAWHGLPLISYGKTDVGARRTSAWQRPLPAGRTQSWERPGLGARDGTRSTAQDCSSASHGDTNVLKYGYPFSQLFLESPTSRGGKGSALSVAWDKAGTL